MDAADWKGREPWTVLQDHNVLCADVDCGSLQDPTLPGMAWHYLVTLSITNLNHASLSPLIALFLLLSYYLCLRNFV
jgi:hypothetical protein